MRGSAVSTITVTALAAVTVAGCSGQGRAALPPKSSPPALPSATLSAVPGSARAAVVAAYSGYFPASKAAEAAGGSRARALLAPYAAQPYLGRVLAQMASYRARGEVTGGRVVPHVIQVRVRGGLAQVHDCQDASGAWLANARTGQMIPHTRGSARTYLIATLARGSDGRWRLTSLAHVAVRCEPVPSSS